MILNVSRFKSASCWRNAFNRHHRRWATSHSINLVDGGAFHDGVAYGMATKNWGEKGLPIIAQCHDAESGQLVQSARNAYGAAKMRFDVEKLKATIPPEQSYLLEDHWDLVCEMIYAYQRDYQDEDYVVIQPECEFDVVLPQTWHSCIWLHWWDAEEQVEKWGPPEPDKILRGSVKDPHGPVLFNNVPIMLHLQHREQCRCWQPHRFVGKTDAIVNWKHLVWLLEHKTTSIQGDPFWGQWDLDIQPTAYIYGIWRSIGLKPKGFILNGLYKPSEAQVAAWNKKRKNGAPLTAKEYIRLEHRGYLRTDEDLMRVERQLVHLCDEWESRIKSGVFDMRPVAGNCMAYNRRCDYHTACLAHDEPGCERAFTPKEDDYVDKKLVQILKGEDIKRC